MTGVVKKIGIVAGSGDVGKRLATGFVKAGYEVLTLFHNNNLYYSNFY